MPFSTTQENDERLTSDTIDASLYWRWIADATKAHETGSDVRHALSASGVPRADADAIAIGIEAYFYDLDRRAWKPESGTGLPDHAYASRMESANPGGQTRRHGVPRWCICAIAAVALAVTALTAKHQLSKSNAAIQPATESRSQSRSQLVDQHRPPQLRSTAPDGRRDVTEHAASAAPTARATHRVDREKTKVAAHSLLQRSSAPGVALPSEASPSYPVQTSPGACPPGVDRLGCPPSSASSSRKSCPLGFRVSGLRCEKVDMPPHAHLEPAGLEWACDAGYVKAGAGCLKLQVPPNAHLDLTGRAWECDAGFVRSANGCT